MVVAEAKRIFCDQVSHPSAPSVIQTEDMTAIAICIILQSCHTRFRARRGNGLEIDNASFGEHGIEDTLTEAVQMIVGRSEYGAVVAKPSRIELVLVAASGALIELIIAVAVLNMEFVGVDARTIRAVIGAWLISNLDWRTRMRMRLNEKDRPKLPNWQCIVPKGLLTILLVQLLDVKRELAGKTQS